MLLLVACAASPDSAAPGDSGVLVDSPADSDSTPPLVYDTAGLYVAGSFSTAGGVLDTLDLGLSWIGGTQVWCHVPGTATIGAPADCPDCDWSYAVTVTAGTREGDHCDVFSGLDAVEAPMFAGTDGFGWSDTYGDVQDVVWARYTFSDVGVTAWLAVAYDSDEDTLVAGDGTGATFTSRLSYYGYTFAE